MTDEISETDRIERELAETRARMDSRLDELQVHLTPKQMLNDAFAYFRGGDGGDFASDLISRAKANPYPVALAGVGIAWLMVSSSDSKKSERPLRARDDLEARYRAAQGNVERFGDEESDGGLLEGARNSLTGVARAASDKAADYAQRLKAPFASASAGDTSNSSHDANIQKGSRNMARTARDTLSSVTSNPIALGAVAALVGLVAGSLIPTSKKEEETIGPMATKLRNTGHDVAQDVVDRGGRIANDMLDAVKSSAEEHGLSAGRPVGELVGDVMHGDLVGNIKQVAQDTLGAAKDSAKTHMAGQQADAPQNG
jgi:ElaB/YqjD/DUF883 family membrane-anchored ribosome-binding protein